ncbi:MAG: PIN domain-containing protein [Promicromonosporaceae bacterium]|nr:PIN domain-containing protein [Promicromonosporaceae bacterium]
MTDFANDPRFTLVGSWLLVTELRRMAVRSGIPQSEVTAVLNGIEIYPLTAQDFEFAGTLPDSGVRSLDALHLQSASALRVDFVVTYDRRMKDVSSRVYGLPVLEPGRDPDDDPASEVARRLQQAAGL